jgi:hypothetical protein
MKCNIKEDISARYKRWSYASHGLAKFEVFAIIDAQEIGRLDCKCIEEDNRICSGLGNDSEREKNLMRDNDHFLFSKLWVLAAYELIRVIRVRCQKIPVYLSKDLGSKIEILESKFLRLRVPLAKKEPEKYHKNDAGIAYPTIHPQYGFGWFVAKDLVVTRRELSDELLQILEEIRKTTE